MDDGHDPARVTRILVPIDLDGESERALGPAQAIAERLGVGLGLFGWHWDVGEVAITRTYLTELAGRLPVDAEVVVRPTRADRGPVEPLLEEAADGATLICMATHARTGVGRAVLGSVAEDLLGRTSEPLLLVGPNVAADGFNLTRPVVVAVDGSTPSALAVPLAAAWAKRLGVPLEVVSAVEPKDAAGAGGADESALVRSVAEEVGATWEVLHGPHPAEAVVRHARDHASLLVVSTHGRTGLARVVAGSVAIRIVHEAAGPVLVTRPPDLA